MGDIIIEEINYKAFVMVLINIITMIASSAVTYFGVTYKLARYCVPGIIVLILSFIGFFTSAVNAIRVKKLLIITRDGIVDNSSINGVGFISFEEIKEFIIVSMNNKKAIAVVPKDIESFMIQINTAKRNDVKRNIAMNLPAVTIRVDKAKDMEPEDILTMLQKRLADFASLYD